MLIPSPENQLDSEIWLPISEEFVEGIIPGKYMISSWGRVLDLETNRLLPKNIYYSRNKYPNIYLQTVSSSYPKFYAPHRLVALHYLYFPGCEAMDVNHKDGIKYHNWWWNLEWCTKSENIQHALDNNLFKLGEDRKNTKVTNEQANEICKLLELGYTPKQISELYKIENANVYSIAKNIKFKVSWKHVSKNYSI